MRWIPFILLALLAPRSVDAARPVRVVDAGKVEKVKPKPMLPPAQRKEAQRHVAWLGKQVKQNREFSMVSQSMKNKHDTAKAALNNIRRNSG